MLYQNVQDTFVLIFNNEALMFLVTYYISTCYGDVTAYVF